MYTIQLPNCNDPAAKAFMSIFMPFYAKNSSLNIAPLCCRRRSVVATLEERSIYFEAFKIGSETGLYALGAPWLQLIQTIFSLNTRKSSAECRASSGKI